MPRRSWETNVILKYIEHVKERSCEDCEETKMLLENRAVPIEFESMWIRNQWMDGHKDRYGIPTITKGDVF